MRYIYKLISIYQYGIKFDFLLEKVELDFLGSLFDIFIKFIYIVKFRFRGLQRRRSFVRLQEVVQDIGVGLKVDEGLDLFFILSLVDQGIFKFSKLDRKESIGKGSDKKELFLKVVEKVVKVKKVVFRGVYSKRNKKFRFLVYFRRFKILFFFRVLKYFKKSVFRVCK